jgi:hypothetical protein
VWQLVFEIGVEMAEIVLSENINTLEEAFAELFGAVVVDCINKEKPNQAVLKSCNQVFKFKLMTQRFDRFGDIAMFESHIHPEDKI